MSRPPLIIEPAILPTRYVTGILPPVFDGSVWLVTLVEDRTGCDGRELLIVDRFSLSCANMRTAVWAALKALKIQLALNSG